MKIFVRCRKRGSGGVKCEDCNSISVIRIQEWQKETYNVEEWYIGFDQTKKECCKCNSRNIIEDPIILNLGDYGEKIGVRWTATTAGEDSPYCIARIAGIPTYIESIQKQENVTTLTDNQALKILQNYNPFSSFENLDVQDLEIDNIAESEGLDPKIRADIQIPTYGKQVLQDQELYLMRHICKRKKLIKEKNLMKRMNPGEDYWNEETKKSGKWNNQEELERDILKGKNEAHEFMLSRLRFHSHER